MEGYLVSALERAWTLCLWFVECPTDALRGEGADVWQNKPVSILLSLEGLCQNIPLRFCIARDGGKAFRNHFLINNIHNRLPMNLIRSGAVQQQQQQQKELLRFGFLQLQHTLVLVYPWSVTQ